MLSYTLMAISLSVLGFGFSVVGVVKYSNYIALLHVVSPEKVESLTFETTESSSKNTQIALHFYYKRYLSDNVELNAFGDSVRSLNICSVACLLAAMIFVCIDLVTS